MSEEPKPVVDYFSGLDLGQAADYSALVVVERTRTPDVLPGTITTFAARHIHRWYLGTSYTQIAAELKEMYAQPPLRDSVLAIDRTGVGRGVSDMIRDSGITAVCRAYSITAGSKPGAGTVPKKELVAAVQVPLQERRLKFAAELPLTPILQRELETFRVKITESRNETFECLVGGTVVETAAGLKPIEEIDSDDLILTRLGYRRVLWAGETKMVSATITVRFSDGAVITGTADHLVWTENRGWVEMALLEEGDTCLSRTIPIRPTCGAVSTQKSLSSTARSIDARQRTRTTSGHQAASEPSCTASSGNSTTAPFRTGTTFTTSTRTPTTTTSRTWSVLRILSTLSGITRTSSLNRASAKTATACSLSVGGAKAAMTIRGSGSVQLSASWRRDQFGNSSARSAGAILNRLGSVATGKLFGSVPRRVPGRSTTLLAPIQLPYANSAEASSKSDTKERNTVHVSAVERHELRSAVPVYDICVDDCHEFFANGILVHNSWRERDHDDLVLALALALYAGRVNNFAAGVVAIPNRHEHGWSKPVWGN